METVIKNSDDGTRLDVFLAKFTGNSRSSVQKLIENNCVKVNGAAASASYKVQNGDVVCILDDLNDKNTPLTPKNIPLDILYEDDDLIVLNKQKGLICHPTAHNRENTLVNALLYHTKNLSNTDPSRQGIVHRLDCDTSGLMLVAKNNFAHEFLQKDIQTKKTQRKYLAVCHGVLENDTGEINTPLVHSMGKTVKMRTASEGLSACTKYKVLERFSAATFVEIKLETGRTHQIRCHFSSINHPIAGDELYGAKAFQNGVFRGLKTKGQVLMSYYLLFTHPKTNEIMEFELRAENYHPDLIKTLNLLRSTK